MKRMIAFIFVMFMLLGIAYYKDSLPQINDCERAVIISKFDNLEIDGDILQSGNDFYYYVDKKECEKAFEKYGSEKIEGVVFYFNNKYDLNYFNNKFNNTLTDKVVVEKCDVYYGYDKDYFDFRLIDGKKVNFQLVNDGNNWILGYPMIIIGF